MSQNPELRYYWIQELYSDRYPDIYMLELKIMRSDVHQNTICSNKSIRIRYFPLHVLNGEADGRGLEAVFALQISLALFL